MTKNRILACAASLSVIAGIVWGGNISGNSSAYASEDEIQVQMVDSVDELDEAMENSGMVQVEETSTFEDMGKDAGEDTAADTESGRYRLKRLVLFADDVRKTYGASEIICYDKYDYYIFGFETERDTEKAYEKMCEDYGADKCMPDEIMYAEDMFAEYDEDPQDSGVPTDHKSLGNLADAAAEYNAVSWGCTYMGMDTLKAEVSYYSVEADVNVAVIDTGVNASNALFKDRINETDSGNCFDSDAAGDYSDSLGHGSHVAGIIADATPDNVKLTIIKCFSDSGLTSGTIIQKGIMTALDLGVDVINMSFCFYGDNAKEDTKTAIDGFIAAAKEQNTVMCVAAGNSGKTGTPMDVEGNSYPADREDVITVSALQKKTTDNKADAGAANLKVSDDTVEFASGYSYYGEKVDFSAPGSAVRSAWKNGGYYTNSGTSMASPHIAAAAAYIKMIEPSLTNEELKSRLIEYSVDLGETGKDIYCGYGCPYMAEYFNDHARKKSQEPGRCSVTSVKNTKTGICVSWNLVENAVGYGVYRKSTGESYSCVDTVTGDASEFVDTNVVSGKRYRYMVRPIGANAMGNAANAMETLRLAQPKAVVNNGCMGIVISWEKSAGASRYNVYRKKTGDSGWTLLKTVPAEVSRLTDSSVVNGMTYRYTVRAYGGADWSSFDPVGSSMYRMATTHIVSVGSPARRTVELKWKKAPEVSGYLIQYSDTSSFAKYRNVTVAGSSAVSYKIAVKNAGTVYYFRMRSYRNVKGKIYYGGWTAVRKVVVKR